MDLSTYTRKDIGNLGESIAAEFFRQKGFIVQDRNWSRKTGELDLVARRRDVLHIIEVKTILCDDFPGDLDVYGPEDNLHQHKISRVIRTAEWYVAKTVWEGEWQVDAVLVWLRKRDALAKVRYIPRISNNVVG